ncbi:MAG: hypothetical protein E6Q57_10390 [Mycobacterium sp.]|nr:MAG: hypothetical protein E6Q57_10390 [Mycobacterium sp.]
MISFSSSSRNSGAAHLRGCSIGERARRLVTVAAPEFRDELEKEISQL